MALFQQFDKLVVLSTRISKFTDSATAEEKTFKYITGFNPVNNQVYVDLVFEKNPDNLIEFAGLRENEVYDCIYKQRQSKNTANTASISSVMLLSHIGNIEFKSVKK